jgi:hypothetical protein
VADNLQTLHAVMRCPDELARVQRDLIRAWSDTLARPKKAPKARLQATGEAARRLKCRHARRVVLVTEKHWAQTG